MVLPGAHSDSEMTPALRTLAARQGLPVTPLAQGNTSGFDAALTDLASSSGTAISRSTAKMMDYPTRPAAQNSASPALRAPLLFALAIVLATAVGMTPTLIRVLHRRQPQPSDHIGRRPTGPAWGAPMPAPQGSLPSGHATPGVGRTAKLVSAT